jgi:FKBP-type peptidyl-prolyl cis-trans isomerase FkpA
MSAYVRRLVRLTAAPALLASLLVTASACKGSNPVNPSDFGIQATDIVAGTGTQLRQGRGATVHYTLWLYDETKPEGKGTQVQTTAGGQTFSFALGYGQVISGWDIGLDGMKVGGTRRLVIPPAYAYGAGGSGQIPGNATLVFDIQLVGVY